MTNKIPLFIAVGFGIAFGMFACNRPSTVTLASAKAPISTGTVSTSSNSARDRSSTPIVADSPSKDLPAPGPTKAELSGVLSRPCIDVIPGGGERAVGENFWKKTILNVTFLEGTKIQKQLVKEYSAEWSNVANIRFFFGNHNPSDIRITFKPNLGHWSYVGTQCLAIPQTDATMNLEFDDFDDHNDIKRVVLHEFGHALGLLHEHQNPKNSIKWDKPKVYAYYAQPPNEWDKKKTDHNVLTYYNPKKPLKTGFEAGPFDKDSIMLYPIPNHLTLDDYEVGWNRVLSAGDINFISKKYPKKL